MTKSKNLTRALLGLSVVCGSLALSGQASAQLYNHQYQGQCLGFNGSPTSAGTPLIVSASSCTNSLYAYVNNVSQRFFTGATAVWKNGGLYYQGYCAGVAGASKQSQASVIVWTCDITDQNNVPDQHWVPEQVQRTLSGHPNATCYVIKNVNAPNLLLSVAPDGRIITWPGDSNYFNENQVWCEDPPTQFEGH